MKVFRTLGIALLGLVVWSGMANAAEKPWTAGTWTQVTPSNTPIAGGHPLLLTDGSVLILNYSCNATGNWYRLVPDQNGNYVTGSWVAAGSLPSGYNPLYFASEVLSNARELDNQSGMLRSAVDGFLAKVRAA